jgi:hypothetical protein
MTDVVIPDFVSDPPLTFYSEEAAGRWLEHLGTVKWPCALNGLEMRQRLAAALGVSEKRIDAILFDSNFHYWLKRALLDFDPIPHETEARSQFIHLAKISHRLQRLRGGRRFQSFSPRRQELSARLDQKWVDCDARWAALEARNPALELRRRMGEVFNSHDHNSWARVAGNFGHPREYAQVGM